MFHLTKRRPAQQCAAGQPRVLLCFGAALELLFLRTASIHYHAGTRNQTRPTGSVNVVCVCTSILIFLALSISGSKQCYSATDAFQQDWSVESLVSVEAENFHGNTSQGGHRWTMRRRAESSGSRFLRAIPNSGANNNAAYATGSPRLNYIVNFVRGGIHYVWLRGRGATRSDDSIHVGLDGVALASSDRISGFRSDWRWSRSTMDGAPATINVAQPGVHTVNVWMREDGMEVDKLVLTADISYSPTGEGPPESPQGDPDAWEVATPVITPASGTFRNSVSVTLETETQGAVLYYTLDGSEPTPSATLYSGPFLLTNSATLKTAAFLGGYTDSDVATADLTITTDGGSGIKDPFVQSPGMQGIVSIDAENYHNTTPQGRHSWELAFIRGYSGAGALEALPNIGTNNNVDYTGTSPRLDFAVMFAHTGTHYVWLRGIGATGSDDSVHVGLDGMMVASSDRIAGFGPDWGWSGNTMDSAPATIEVAHPGLHTLNVWMREDGFALDKLVLTTDRAFVPAGNGPAESAKEGDSDSGSGSETDSHGFPMELPGLPPFQATSAAVRAKLPTGWTKPKTCRLLKANRPAHPSIGSFTKKNSVAAAYLERYDAVDFMDGEDVPYREDGKMVTGGGARHIQWDLDDDTERLFFVVKSNHALYRSNADTKQSFLLLNAAKLNAALGTNIRDKDIHIGPYEGLSAGKARNGGKALAFGYFIIGRNATFFAYNVTDDKVLPNTQTHPLLYGEPFDFTSVSLDSGYGIIKPRPQSDSSSVPWWFFPLDPVNGVRPKVHSKVNGTDFKTVSHASPCYRIEGPRLVEAWCSLVGSSLNVFRLHDGERITNKPVEGDWAEHIGYVDNTPFVVTDDSAGNLTAERTDGAGGHPLGTGWNGSSGYSHLSRYIPGQDMKIIGQRGNGDVELWWW